MILMIIKMTIIEIIVMLVIIIIIIIIIIRNGGRGSFEMQSVYEVTSKIFRTGAAIYTAVVVAQSTDRWYDYHV
jgi:hypothetical protein